MGAVGFLGTSIAFGQSSIASYNGLHAIVGAKIFIGDGRVIEKGTLVLRNGLIESVGPDTAVPRGAEVFDGKGLIVYPGFIDSFTNKGFVASSPGTRPTIADQNADNPSYASAFMRESNRVGIRPEVQASQGVGFTDDILKGYQGSGFTTVLLAPTGGDLSGMAALVNLSGRPPRESIVSAQVGEVIGFSGPGGDPYPSSLMGHIAQVRQALYDANWLTSLQKSFAAGGNVRPPADDSLSALQPMLSGRIPALIDGDTSAQISRALNLSHEFGLRPWIVGGTEAWKKVTDIKAGAIPLLLSLPFTAEPDAPKAGSTDPADNPSKYAERKRIYDEGVKNVSVLATEGVPFALTTKGTSSTSAFLDNLRKVIKVGLSKETALKALTSGAAKILGVDRLLGTIEPGKVANVFVATTEFTDPKMAVKMLYIDGRKIDPGASKPQPTFRPQFNQEGGN